MVTGVASSLRTVTAAGAVVGVDLDQHRIDLERAGRGRRGRRPQAEGAAQAAQRRWRMHRRFPHHR